MKQFKNILKNFLDNNFLYYIDKLLKKPNLDNGFLPSKIKDADYIHKEGTFGLVAKRPLLQDGQWDKYRPKGELQKRNGQDKIACVTFSSLNVLEELIRFMMDSDYPEHKEIVKILKYFEIIKDGEVDCSDRHIAKLSGTTRRGNSFSNVADTIHNYGLVAEHLYPWVDDWNDYYKVVPQAIIDKGKELLEYIDIKHEWVYSKDFNRIKIYAPHTTSVYAGWDWNEPNKIHKKTGNSHNHAVCNDGYVLNEFDKIFDSYIPFDKKADWNYGLGMGKQFTILLKKKLPNQREQLINNGRQYVMRTEQGTEARGEIYELQKDKLVYISPKEWNNRAVKEKSLESKLIGITEEKFKQLTN